MLIAVHSRGDEEKHECVESVVFVLMVVEVIVLYKANISFNFLHRQFNIPSTYCFILLC